MRTEAHWYEYAIEAALLGAFMVSASAFTVLLQHPESIARAAIANGAVRRALVGLAMGATAVALIYSPWGRRSGAHFNPAVTIAFHRLGKIGTRDAIGYVVAQCAGGIAGIELARLLLGMSLADPSVGFVATVPGAGGIPGAFVGEIVISFLQMATVLVLANGRHARATGLVAGALVATWISIEGPLSGTSMNPARSLASAVAAHVWTGFWVYLTAPVIGMLAAAEAYVHTRGADRVLCAKLRHDDGASRCIFRCGYGARGGASTASCGRTAA
ncbi:MAG TPA: aquaporin [Candidatus Binatia bacterium]|nr:aquaporin [Candidatus Binatia bacterium]